MNKDVMRMKKMVIMSEVQRGDDVLDLGCKDMILNKFLPSVFYTGIDIEDIRPKFWAKHITTNGKLVGDTKFINHDLERGLPKQLKNKKFDVIFMGELIEHIENFKSLLVECRDVLKDNGKIILSTPNPSRLQFKSNELGHIHSFNQINMKNLASKCGLRITQAMGTRIYIPILKVNIPTSVPSMSDNIIYRMEK